MVHLDFLVHQVSTGSQESMENLDLLVDRESMETQEILETQEIFPQFSGFSRRPPDALPDACTKLKTTAGGLKPGSYSMHLANKCGVCAQMFLAILCDDPCHRIALVSSQ